MESMPVRVLVVVGDQAHITTPERGVDDPLLVPAETLAGDVGVPVSRLAGRSFTALVEGGELRGFAG